MKRARGWFGRGAWAAGALACGLLVVAGLAGYHRPEAQQALSALWSLCAVAGGW